VRNDGKTQYEVNRQKRKSAVQIYLPLAITLTRIQIEISLLIQNSLPHNYNSSAS